MELHAYSDIDQMNIEISELLVKKIKYYANMQKIYTIALSGGSTPQPLYYILQSYFAKNPKIAKYVSLFQVDERLVGSNSDRSNQNMIASYFENVCKFYPYPVEKRHLGELEFLDECMASITQHLPASKSEKITFDCVILGMGTDGHTASLFPSDPSYVASLANEQNVIITNPEGLEPRVSLTSKVINRSPLRILMFKGVEKVEIFSKALESGDSQTFPVVSIIKQGLKIYTSFIPELLGVKNDNIVAE